LVNAGIVTDLSNTPGALLGSNTQPNMSISRSSRAVSIYYDIGGAADVVVEIECR
jgi:hypothetical protein